MVAKAAAVAQTPPRSAGTSSWKKPTSLVYETPKHATRVPSSPFASSPPHGRINGKTSRAALMSLSEKKAAKPQPPAELDAAPIASLVCLDDSPAMVAEAAVVILEDATMEPLPTPSPSPSPDGGDADVDEAGSKTNKRKGRPPPVPPQQRVQEKMPIEMVGRKEAPAAEGENGGATEESYMGHIVAERILQAANNYTRAKRLIAWFKERVERGIARVHGRDVTKEDMEAAELRVVEVWRLRLDRMRRPTIGNVELVMQRTAQRCEHVDAAKEVISNIAVGKVTRKGRMFSQGDLVDAENRCQQLFERIPGGELLKDMVEEGVEAQRMATGDLGYISDLSSDEGESEESDDNGKIEPGFEAFKVKSKKSVGEGEKGQKLGLADAAEGEEGDEEEKEEESEEEDLSSEEEVDVEEEGVHKEEDLEAAPKRNLTRTKAGTGAWAGAPTPGTPGFNDFAVALMRKAGVATSPLRATLDKSLPCPPMQPHQEAAVFLLKSESPITRILVDHPTGCGKTREMIDTLNCYFQDPRPKVPIFPKEAVCRNFYAELLRWPSLYRDYFSCLRPGSAACCAGVRDWRMRRNHLWDLSGFLEKDVRELTRDIERSLK